MNPGLELEESGFVYRNPKPHLRAVNAVHPSLSVAPSRELIATFDLGQGQESMDYHTVVARSSDGGRNWNIEGRLLASPPERTTHTVRTSLLSDGRMLGLGCFYQRDDPEEGMLNRENLGLVPCRLFLVESADLGRTWSAPRFIHLPIESSGWEVSHCPLELPDGRLGLALCTWRGWDGSLPAGQQSVLFLSSDRGATWPVFSRTFDDRQTGLIHWEQSVVLRGKEALAVAWEFDPRTRQSRPSVFAVSRGDPPAFGRPIPTGFQAETCELLPLDFPSVLAVFRRVDQPGLWATIARVEGEEWKNGPMVPLWQGADSHMLGRGVGADELSGLKFGSPSMKALPGGRVLVTFWCHEDEVSVIRWLRLRLP